MENKSWFASLIAKIGSWFDWVEDLFDSAEKAWDNLEEPVKQALEQASGIVDIINKGLDLAPAFIYEKIQEKFPDLTEQKLRDAIGEVSAALNIEITTDLFQTIKNIQEYLSTKVKENSIGEGILSTMAQMLAIALSPDKTPFAKIAMMIEYVYRSRIKKD